MTPEYSVFPCIYRENADYRELEFLTIMAKYTHPDFAHLPEQWKLPGGKSQEIDGGDPVMTVLREMREETGLTTRIHPHFAICIPDFSDGYRYDRYFFPIRWEECFGTLRDTPLQEKKSILSPPFWAKRSDLLREYPSKAIHRTHRVPLIRLVERVIGQVAFRC